MNANTRTYMRCANISPILLLLRKGRHRRRKGTAGCGLREGRRRGRDWDRRRKRSCGCRRMRRKINS